MAERKKKGSKALRVVKSVHVPLPLYRDIQRAQKRDGIKTFGAFVRAAVEEKLRAA